MKRWILGFKRVQYLVAFFFLVRELSLSDYKRFSEVPAEDRILMMQRGSLQASWWMSEQRGEEIPPMAVKWRNGEISHAEMVAEVERVTGKRFS